MRLLLQMLYKTIKKMIIQMTKLEIYKVTNILHQLVRKLKNQSS